MKCLNCSNHVEGNFCSFCGQKASTHRFSLNHILDDGIVNGVLMVNRGVLFTLKKLFTKPGHSIREYINGKRVKYFNAFSLLLILVAIAYFIDNYSSLRLVDVMNENSKNFAKSMEEFMKKYPRLIFVLNIPLMAISSYLFFRKSKLNFAEHIILNTYTSVAQVAISIPFTLLTVFYKDKSVLIPFYQFVSFISIGYYFWFYYQFFSVYPYKKIGLIVRTILSILTFVIIQGLIFAMVVIIRNNILSNW